MKTQRFREYVAKNWWKQEGMGNEHTMIANNHLCMAVRTNHNVILRGQTGFDFEGNMHDLDDVVAQTKTACACLKQLIREAGGDPADICKITLYFAERSFVKQAMPVVDEAFKDICPSKSMLITKLALPEVLMEIDADVVVE